MIDRRKENYQDYYWILVRNLNGLREDQILHHDDGYNFYPNQYAFESLAYEHKYIIKISPLNNDEMYRTSSFSHTFTAKDVVIRGIYELFSRESFQKLWDDGVAMIAYANQLFSFFAHNGYYRPLAWFIERYQDIVQEDFDYHKITKLILCPAIENNNSDIIDFVTYNLQRDLSIYEDDTDVLTSISKLIATQYAGNDFCYKTIENLLYHDLMKDKETHKIVIQMFDTMCSTLGHEKTSSLFQSIEV